MEILQQQTLAWVEFLWRVSRDAPDKLADWITIYLFCVYLYDRYGKRGVKHVVELKDVVTVSDALEVRPALLNLGPSEGRGGGSLKLTTPALLNLSAGGRAMQPALRPVPIRLGSKKTFDGAN